MRTKISSFTAKFIIAISTAYILICSIFNLLGMFNALNIFVKAGMIIVSTVVAALMICYYAKNRSIGKSIRSVIIMDVSLTFMWNAILISGTL